MFEHIIKIIIVAFGFMIVVPGAYADDNYAGSSYVGASVFSGFREKHTAGNDESSVREGYKIFAGHRFGQSQKVFIEIGLYDFGDLKFVSLPGTKQQPTGYSFFVGFNILNKKNITLPIKLGEFKINTHSSGGGSSDKVEGLSFGIGVDYSFSKTYGLVAGYERFFVWDIFSHSYSVHLLNVGIRAKF